MFAERLHLEVSAILNSAAPHWTHHFITTSPTLCSLFFWGGLYTPSLKPETLISSLRLPFPHIPQPGHPKLESTSSLDLASSQLSPSTCFCVVLTYSFGTVFWQLCLLPAPRPPKCRPSFYPVFLKHRPDHVILNLKPFYCSPFLPSLFSFLNSKALQASYSGCPCTFWTPMCGPASLPTSCSPALPGLSALYSLCAVAQISSRRPSRTPLTNSVSSLWEASLHISRCFWIRPHSCTAPFLAQRNIRHLY